MTPAEYITIVCEPEVAALVDDPTSVRRAMVAAIVLFHVCDHLGEGDEQKTKATKANIGLAFPQFQGVADIANASKHAVRSSGARKGLSVGDMRVGRAAAFSDGSYYSDGSTHSDAPDVIRVEFNGEQIDVVHLCKRFLAHIQALVQSGVPELR
jgi:hypothetical protein